MSKQALIVGGTTGMGKSSAELLLKEGVEVIIIGRPNGKLQQAVSDLSAFGKVEGIGLDLTDFSAVIHFLLTDKSSWVTGAVWDIDGGVMAGRN